MYIFFTFKYFLRYFCRPCKITLNLTCCYNNTTDILIFKYIYILISFIII